MFSIKLNVPLNEQTAVAVPDNHLPLDCNADLNDFSNYISVCE